MRDPFGTGELTLDRFASLGNPTMTMKGLSVTFHMPKASLSQLDGAGDEVDLRLPPSAPRRVYSVDEFDQHCHDSWLRGEAGKSASYFGPVKPEYGAWFDFNANLRHQYNVAVLISIQGVNALTAKEVKGLRLAQYKERCPVHDLPFTGDRFCAHKDCGFAWPHQNYLASAATPYPYYWLDGFRAKDGVTRQFVFTEDEMRGVAANVLGAKRSFAIGFAFFLSKEQKPVPVREPYRGGGFLGGSSFDDSSLESFGAVAECAAGPPYARRSAAKNIEVAAGARIIQQVFPDHNPVDYYEDEPAAVIYLNYCQEQTAIDVLSAARPDIIRRREGPLAGLPVGHFPGQGKG